MRGGELCVDVGVQEGLSLCVSVQCVGNCDCERVCVSGCEAVRCVSGYGCVRCTCLYVEVVPHGSEGIGAVLYTSGICIMRWKTTKM